LSLRNHIRLASNRYIDLNIIYVYPGGIFYPSPGPEEWREIERALQVARSIFAQIGLGINRVWYYELLDRDYSNITSEFRAKQLTRKYRGERDAIDCFFVHSLFDTVVGIAPIKGPSSNKSGWFNGLLVARRNFRSREINPDIMGLILAHELGHYLGLNHVCEMEQTTEWRCGVFTFLPVCGAFMDQLLMYPKAVITARHLSNEERTIILQHSFVRR
jgi:hypothetical protein